MVLFSTSSAVSGFPAFTAAAGLAAAAAGTGAAAAGAGAAAAGAAAVAGLRTNGSGGL